MRTVFGTGCLLSLTLPCGQAMAQPSLDNLVDRDIAALLGTYKALCGTELEVTHEGIPDVIPAAACYMGWQESLVLLGKLVEADIPDGG